MLGRGSERRPAGARILALRAGWRGAAPGGAVLAGFRAWLFATLAREGEHRTPFLWLPIAFGLGIIAYFAAAEEPRLWAAPLLAAVVLPFALRSEGMLRAVLFALLFIALGFSAGAFRTALVAAPMLDRERLAEVRGFVETIDHAQGRQRLLIRPVSIEGLNTESLPYRLRIGASGRTGPKPGEFVVLRARLSPPSEAAMPGGYDFRREAFFRGIGGVGFAIGALRNEAAPYDPPYLLTISAAVDRARNALTERISRTIDGEAGALAAALITGKRGLIGEETNENLRAAGLYHIVSISGLHMVLAAGILFWTVRALLAAFPALALRQPIKKYAAGAAMLGATAYCVFSGSEVATERSLIMTLVMLGAILVDRPALAMRNVAIAALIVMAREPEALAGPSFQMSFAAVASLIAAHQVWQDHRAGRAVQERGLIGRIANRLVLAFLGIAATTIVATLATAPFSAFHFSRLNPYGLIGNTLAIPLVSLIVMPAAVAGTLAVPFGLDGLVWSLMGIGVEGVLIVAAWVAGFEHASLPVPMIRGWTFALLVAGLIVFVALRTALRALALVFAGLAGIGLAGLGPAVQHVPDLVVEPSGRLALIRHADGRYRILALGNPSRFTLQQWLPALGDDRAPNDTSLRADIACDRAGCVGRLADGRQVALVTRLEALREDCARADIIITPLAAIPGCAGRRVLDRVHFDRHGATRITSRTHAEWRAETALDPQRDRPWRRPKQEAAAVPAGISQTPPAIPRRPAETGADDPGLAPPENVGTAQ